MSERIEMTGRDFLRAVDGTVEEWAIGEDETVYLRRDGTLTVLGVGGQCEDLTPSGADERALVAQLATPVEVEAVVGGVRWTATLLAGCVDIYEGAGVWAGSGVWQAGAIRDCAADLPDGVYETLEAALGQHLEPPMPPAPIVPVYGIAFGEYDETTVVECGSLEDARAAAQAALLDHPSVDVVELEGSATHAPRRTVETHERPRPGLAEGHRAGPGRSQAHPGRGHRGGGVGVLAAGRGPIRRAGGARRARVQRGRPRTG